MLPSTFHRNAWICVVIPILAMFTKPARAQQAEEITINVKGMENVDARGNAHVQWVMNFTPARGYDRIKRIYPNLYVLFRDLGPERSGYEINRGTLKITPDDGQRSITVNADFIGAAVSRKNRWQIQTEPDEQISNQDGNKVFTVAQSGPKNGVKITFINTYVLPVGAQNVQLGSDHFLTYSLAVAKALPAAGPPQVDVSVRHRKRLMSAVYKVYGEMEAGDGAYWVAKTVFKNSGKVPIYNLKIYYRLGDYTETSVPEPYSWIAAGGVVVDRYYPVIRSKVAELKNETPVQLYVRYEYADAAGKSYSGEATERLAILGINQFEFSNLDDEDRTDNWRDYFNNAPLLAAFVTKMDDPVRQFAGYASHRSGMTAPASRTEDAIAWLQAAYETELHNDIVYTTPSGSFLTADNSGVQDIKYPRDVFRDKTGTCIDLAITYAALAESVGLHAILMVVPGHTFAVIRLPNGQYLPVENTSLGGGNQRAGFEQAVKAGQKEFGEYLQDGRFYLVDVQKEWDTDRVPTPELPQLASDFLEKSGIRPWDGRTGGGPATGGGARNAQAGTALAGNAIQGTAYRVVHDHGIGTLAAFCVGVLYISGEEIAFQAERASDGRMDRFVIKKSDIKEAKKNRMPLGQNGNYFEGFHIRLMNGVNYNLANIDQNGRGLSADTVLMELMRAN
ncbi:MAG TPA: hypothetical protein VNX66_04335 [Candidatus Sulfotelmatobacter sp.]|jgi:hypothetical protein|nr:hypothetical protein [Candidatus Sulfotelmatobacter sp.]